MAINDNVKALTDEHGCIKDGQLASYVRCSMENKNLLQNKYDIYVGTGEYVGEADSSEKYVSRETEGMNIVDAINGAATELPAQGLIKRYNPVKYARWGAENTNGAFDPTESGEAELRIENGKHSEVKILGYNEDTDIETAITKYSFWRKRDVQCNITLDVSKDVSKIETGIIQTNHYDTASSGAQISFSNDDISLTARDASGNGNMTVKGDKITATVPYVGAIGSSSDPVSVNAGEILCSSINSSGNNGISAVKISAGAIASSGAISADGEITAASFNAKSDARLKTNIKSFNYHNSILDIPVREYDWKESGEHAIGFVAQELQEIYPELVSEGEDGTLRIKETKLVYLLMEEVKKLKEEVEKLKKEG